MEEHDRDLLGLDDYTRELSRIMRALLPAGANRDYNQMIELAQELEKLARTKLKGAGQAVPEPHLAGAGGFP